MKKPITIFVLIAFILSLVATSAVAIEPSCANGGELKYVSLGDSIAGGIGLPDSPLRGPDQPDKTKVYCSKTIGAYPALVADALGIKNENFTQLACAGMRSVELRACIDPSYTCPDKYANNFTENELEEWVTSRFDFRAYIENADIITLNMCANDIAAYALFCAKNALSGTGVSNTAIDATIGCLEKADGCGIFDSIVKLLEFSAKLGSYAMVAKAAIDGLYEGYNRWKENWDAIIGIIYRLNPDVMLVCLGMNNPFNHLKLTEHSFVEIGAAVSGIIKAINCWAAVGSRYACKYIYVDIMGIETIGEEQGDTLTDPDFFENFELNVHPSVKGQQQIADRIMNRLSCDKAIQQYIR